MWVPIIPEHIWAHVSPSVAQSSYAVKLPLVGSGPFTTVQFKKGSYIHLQRNPNYWGPKPAIDDVYFLVYQDADTMVTDLKSGNIDAASGLPQAQFSALKSDASFKAVPYSYYNWNYLEFNSYTSSSSLGNPVLRDVKFRSALNYAVDKSRLATLAYDGYAQPATTVIPPNFWKNPDYHWQPPAGQAYTFDLAKASSLLTQAGYKLSSKGQRLDLRGKPIKLRLYTSTDSSPEQSEAKLVTGGRQPGPEDHPVGGRPGHAAGRHLQLQGQGLGSRLRPRGVELDGLLRPRPDAACVSPRRRSAVSTSRTGRTPSTTR